MTTTSISSRPYYDDFDTSKNFAQILFKPGVSVQSRELTQIQSILRDQIAKFGNHIFQQGSIVIPGNSFYDLSVPYVKIQSVSSTLSLFDGLTLIGQTSGVTGVVKKVIPATSTDPITFYIAYISGGDIVDNKTYTKFLESEVIRTSDSTFSAIVKSTLATGSSSLAYVNTGVYFVNGTFVHVDAQSTIISKYTSIPSCRVVFRILEEIVTSASDSTLLDPAQGSNNFAAPGADRLKLSLELTTIALDAVVTDEYIELMKFDLGVLKEHARYPKYSELEKTLARRTFDESGNYISNGLVTVVREHNKNLINSGVYINGDNSKLIYELSPGKAYISGYETENLYSQQIIVDKARTVDHIVQDSRILNVSYGQYFYITEPMGSLNIQENQVINLYSDSAGTIVIGSASVIALDYFSGDGTYPVYKLYVNNVSFTSGNIDSVTFVKSTQFSARLVVEYNAPITTGGFVHDDIINFSGGTRTAKVALYNNSLGKLYAYKYSAASIPSIGDFVVGSISSTSSVISGKTSIVNNSSSGRIINLPTKATKSLTNSSDEYDFEYTAWTKLTIPEGSSTVSISSGIIVPIETGTFIALDNSGLDTSSYTISSGTVITRLLGVAPAGGINIYCQVNITNASPRIKTIVETTTVHSSSSIVTLSYPDVFKISSIVSGGVELLNNYTLDSGATDYIYDLSKILIKNGINVPSGNITVRYSYFAHSTGDFFSVDSYPSLLSEEIPYYQSASSGIVYSLRDCIDFRKTVGINSNSLTVDTIITTSIKKYVPRIDVLCLDNNGQLNVVRGTPAEFPKTPSVSSNYFSISKYTIPAYTYSVSDIVKKEIAVNKYSMEDVNNINNKLQNLEEYSLLTAAELGVLNTSYVDAETGLDKYRTGYFVESMENAYIMANTSDGFSATLNTRGIYSKLEESSVSLSVTSNSNTVTINGMTYLPYSEVVHAKVDVSSRITNLNPFQVISWIGNLKMTPSSDVWSEQFYYPEIVKYNTINIVTEVMVWTSAAIVVTPTFAPARGSFTRSGGNWGGTSSSFGGRDVGGWGGGGWGGDGGFGNSSDSGSSFA